MCEYIYMFITDYKWPNLPDSHVIDIASSENDCENDSSENDSSENDCSENFSKNDCSENDSENDCSENFSENHCSENFSENDSEKFSENDSEYNKSRQNYENNLNKYEYSKDSIPDNTINEKKWLLGIVTYNCLNNILHFLGCLN